MENYEILLRDSTYSLVKEASELRGKDISNTIDDIIRHYFQNENKKEINDITVKFDKHKEIWKDIPGYENLYQASNMGRIASIRYGFKLRSLVRHTTGYLQCAIKLNNTNKNYMVHVLIANTFMPEICEGCTEIDHVNNVKYDNRLENLKRVSRSQNIKNNYDRGISLREKCKFTKRVRLFNQEGKSIGILNSVKEAAKFLNTSMGNVSSLCNNKNGIKSLTKDKITAKFIREKRPNYRKLKRIKELGYEKKTNKQLILEKTQDQTSYSCLDIVKLIKVDNLSKHFISTIRKDINKLVENGKLKVINSSFRKNGKLYQKCF